MHFAADESQVAGTMVEVGSLAFDGPFTQEVVYCVIGYRCEFFFFGLGLRSSAQVLVVFGEECYQMATKAGSTVVGDYFINPAPVKGFNLTGNTTLSGGVPVPVTYQLFQPGLMGLGEPENILSLCWAAAPADDTPGSFVYRVARFEQTRPIDRVRAVQVIQESVSTDSMDIIFFEPFRLDQCLLERWEVWLQFDPVAKLYDEITVSDADPWTFHVSGGSDACRRGLPIQGLVHETFYRFKVRPVCRNLPRIGSDLDSDGSAWTETLPLEAHTPAIPIVQSNRVVWNHTHNPRDCRFLTWEVERRLFPDGLWAPMVCEDSTLFDRSQAETGCLQSFLCNC
jgi:hypothetical protein